MNDETMPAETMPGPSADLTAELASGLADNSEAPFGASRSIRSEELVALAEKLNDPTALAVALLELVESYYFSLESAKAFVPFTRALRLYDDHPESFDDDIARHLHWSFKWMTEGMLKHPQVSLSQIEQAVTEMRRRYGAAGYGDNGVLTVEFSIARHVGDRDRAQLAYERWMASERDEMSHCEACGPSLRAEWLVEQGHDSEALELLQQIDGLECGSEPHTALATSLFPLVRAQQYAQARANHITGYRLVRGSAIEQGNIGRHLAFCARTGNVDRGLRLWAECAPTLSEDDQPLERFALLEGAITLLEQARKLHGPSHPVASSTGIDTTVEDLLESFLDEARTTARRFDDRNGTSAFATRLEAALSATPLAESLEFVTPRTTPRTALGEADTTPPTTPAPTMPGSTTRPPADLPRPRPSADADLDAWLAHAQALADVEHPAATDAWRQVMRLAPEPDLLPAPSRAAVLHGRADLLARHAPNSETSDAYVDAARARLAVGDTPRAVRALARGALFGVSGASDWRALGDEAVALAEASGDGPAAQSAVDSAWAFAVSHRALSLTSLGPDSDEFATVLSDLTAARERAAQCGDLGLASDIDTMVGYNHHVFSDEALPAATRAVEAAQASSEPWRAVAAQRALGAVLRARDNGVASMQALREALEVAHQFGDGVAVAGVNEQLGDGAAADDQPHEAASYALEAARSYDLIGDHPSSLRCYVDLAQRYLWQGRQAEAAELMEQVRPEIDHLQPGDQMKLLHVLGDAHLQLGEFSTAAQRLIEAARMAESQEWWFAAGDLAFGAAKALGRAEMTAESVAALTHSADLFDRADEPLAQASVLRWLARVVATSSHEGADGSEEALARIEEARTVLAPVEPGAGVAYEFGELCDLAARCLATRGDFEDAASQAAEAMRWHDASGSVVDRGHAATFAGEMLSEHLGRPEEAEPLVRLGIECFQESQPEALPGAYMQLSSVLDSLGRTQESAAAITDAETAAERVWGAAHGQD